MNEESAVVAAVEALAADVEVCAVRLDLGDPPAGVLGCAAASAADLPGVAQNSEVRLIAHFFMHLCLQAPISTRKPEPRKGRTVELGKGSAQRACKLAPKSRHCQVNCKRLKRRSSLRTSLNGS